MSPHPSRRAILSAAVSTTGVLALGGPAIAIASTAPATVRPREPVPQSTWSTSRVGLFFSAHQDDELLQMGSQVRADVEAGHHVVLVNCADGSASGARTGRLAQKLGYVPSVEDMVRQRDGEFLESAGRLGVPAQGRIISPDRWTDRTGTPAAALRVIAPWLAQFPDALVRTHSFVDAHPDHRSLGEAVNSLVLDGTLSTERDVRFFFSRVYRDTMPTPLLSTITRPVGDVEHTPYRDHDPAHGRWGVGYLSTRAYFDSHRADPVSYWHRASSSTPPVRPLTPVRAVPAGFAC